MDPEEFSPEDWAGAPELPPDKPWGIGPPPLPDPGELFRAARAALEAGFEELARHYLARAKALPPNWGEVPKLADPAVALGVGLELFAPGAAKGSLVGFYGDQGDWDTWSHRAKGASLGAGGQLFHPDMALEHISQAKAALAQGDLDAAARELDAAYKHLSLSRPPTDELSLAWVAAPSFGLSRLPSAEALVPWGTWPQTQQLRAESEAAQLREFLRRLGRPR